jgi:hypothetical protein
MLPVPQEGEQAYDTTVHPLHTPLKPYIEEALKEWQEDLKEGRETKKWRDQAMQAGASREAGEFDEWKASEEEKWYGGKENDEEEGKGEEAKGVDDEVVAIEEAEAA